MGVVLGKNSKPLKDNDDNNNNNDDMKPDSKLNNLSENQNQKDTIIVPTVKSGPNNTVVTTAKVITPSNNKVGNKEEKIMDVVTKDVTVHIKSVDEEENNENELLDVDTKILNNVSSMLEDFLSKCSLTKPLEEWATSDISKQAKGILFLTIKYDKISLTKEQRIKVSSRFLEFNYINICHEFLKYSVIEVADIFQNDESVYTDQIKILQNEKNELEGKKKNKENNEEKEKNEKDKLENKIENTEDKIDNIEDTIKNIIDVNENEVNDSKEQVISLTEKEIAERQVKVDQLKAEITRLKTQRYAQSIIGSLMAGMINNTSVDIEFCKCCSENNMLATLVEFFQIYAPLLQETDKESYQYSQMKFNGRLRIFNYILGTMLNSSKVDECNEVLKELNAVEKGLPYFKCPIQLFSMKILLLLSNLIEESNNHLIMADEEPIKLLLTYIKGAIRGENNRYYGFDLTELIGGLALIACNDNNSKIIGENDGIKIISFALLSSNYIDNEADKMVALSACCQAVWRLSFHEANRERLCQDKAVVEFLKMLKEMRSEDKDLQKVASGSYWEIVGKHMREVDAQHQDVQADSGDVDERHIMISYQWSHQDILLKVRDQLQELGYKVWMDIDQMGGSTLEAMAAAVEDACIILMTISNPYKQSANCRSEAEYAYQLKRTIVPLMMQSNYSADGWLGFILGSKYWIDFADQAQFDTSFKSLMKEITQHIKSESNNAPAKTKVAETVHQSTTVTKQTNTSLQSIVKTSTIEQLSTLEVKEWLEKLNLKIKSEKYENNIDGKLLSQLRNVKKEAPETFYQMCRQDLGFDFIEAIKFADELKDL